jgi:FkbM family methyltransferase
MAVRIEVANVPAMSLDLGPRANSHFLAGTQSPNWEPLETQLFIKLLSDQPRVLDIGANIGWFTCIGAKITGLRGIFFAFEPDPDNFSALINNVTSNRLFNVRPFRIALGNEDQEGKLFLSHENLGDHRINAVEGRPHIPIQIAKLDTVLSGLNFAPDLLKIDVQGAETVAFEGGRNAIYQGGKNCAKLIEFWPGGMRGGVEEACALAEKIFDWGQAVYVCHHEGSGSIRLVDLPTLSKAIHGCIHPSKPSYLDLFVAPEDNRMERLKDVIGPAWEPWA